MLLLLSVLSGTGISLLTAFFMKKFCNVTIAAQLTGTLMITTIVASLFAMINTTVPISAFKLIALLAFVSIVSFASSKGKQIPDVILLFAGALRLIIGIVESMSLKGNFSHTLFRDVTGLILGVVIVFIVNKFSNGFFSINELKLFAVMGAFSGYICTYMTLIVAVVFAFIIEKYISQKSNKKIHISFEPLVLCGYILSMILCKS